MTALSPAKQTAFEKVGGLWIAIPTPFTPDLEIDEGLLRKSVDYYIEGLGVDGIFCGGVMGEFWSMTVEERARCHELVVGAAAGRVPVMAHIGHHVYSEAAQLSRHAEQIGADFVIAMNPYFPIKPSDDIVRDWYRRLTAESSVPFFLFNTSYSGYALSPSLIAELSELETVCGIKNPKSREHLLEVQDRVGDRIVVCDADEGDWLEPPPRAWLQVADVDAGAGDVPDTEPSPDPRLHPHGRLRRHRRSAGTPVDAGAGARCLPALDARPVAGTRRGGDPDRRAQDVARSDGSAPGPGAPAADPDERGSDRRIARRPGWPRSAGFGFLMTRADHPR